MPSTDRAPNVREGLQAGICKTPADDRLRLLKDNRCVTSSFGLRVASRRAAREVTLNECRMGLGRVPKILFSYGGTQQSLKAKLN